jgi:hypothetical protein|tara:strand:+ start:1007 stop:1210 length:204 start_codon:yes stop_codon:yes gene_type:complete
MKRKLTNKEIKSLLQQEKRTKKLLDELVILDDCVVTGTFKWRSEIDPNWTPRVWNETFECWTKNYCG